MSLAKYKIKAEIKQDIFDKELRLSNYCWCGCGSKIQCYDDYWDGFDYINQVWRSRHYWDQDEEYWWEWWNDSPERLRESKLDELLNVDRTQRLGDFYKGELQLI
jgi:hypothetical protein